MTDAAQMAAADLGRVHFIGIGGGGMSGIARIMLTRGVTVSGSDMTIDLSGCSPQREGGINGRTYAGAYIAYKALTGPNEPLNEGAFAALKVIIPEGNMMMAKFPAGLIIYWSWNNTLSVAQQWLIQRSTKLAKPSLART